MLLILPRLLFVLWLTKNDHRHIQKRIENFIREGRQPKFKNNILQLSKDQGGLSFSNIECYYQAVLTKYVIQWFDSCNSWNIELTNINIPLIEWCLLAGAGVKLNTTNQILAILLNIWKGLNYNGKRIWLFHGQRKNG